MNCSYCSNRGIFWIDEGACNTCIPCPVCQGKSANTTDLRVERENMIKHYAAINRTEVHAND